MRRPIISRDAPYPPQKNDVYELCPQGVPFPIGHVPTAHSSLKEGTWDRSCTVGQRVEEFELSGARSPIRVGSVLVNRLPQTETWSVLRNSKRDLAKGSYRTGRRACINGCVSRRPGR
ncbi:unnamed protein product (mitochondrion) [Plasmodiophora brassicae]|uniref:Uncharacterized protein n=1 Tax=Plasmodiophora brassicae TaxID=37360 RepID=A0A0G4J611_PLABS|nr:hypothetical protein PBRA_002776 [Plasmodiophora brassicae]SPQ94920.1 unnamed protein product [Plasmodiophora brassicae]